MLLLFGSDFALSVDDLDVQFGGSADEGGSLTGGEVVGKFGYAIC